MIVRPCPTHVAGCPCINDDPFQNLSSEAPDPADVIRMGFAAADPPLNAPDNYWDIPFGLGSCAGTDAQDTQDCANGQAEGDVLTHQTLFRSVQRTCSVPCPDGSIFSYTLKAGVVVEATQALADALAASICLYRAEQARQCGPTAVTGLASDIDDNSATIAGTVNPNGVSTSYFFQWGTSTSYGNITPVTNIGNGRVTLPALANLTGLTGGTTYHYRIVAVNSKGTAMGADATFDTTISLVPLAWWKMEEAAGNLVDIISGKTLVKTIVSGNVAYHAAGKVNFGIGINGAAGGGFLDVFFDTGVIALPYAGVGIDFTLWHKITSAVNSVFHIFTYTFPGGDILDFFYNVDTQLFTLDSTGASLTFVRNVIDGAYHMYRVFFDPISGDFGFDIDNVNVQTGLTPMNPAAGANSELLFEAQTVNVFNPSNFNVFWDELAIWPRPLTTGEVDAIWNGGAGTTWPL